MKVSVRRLGVRLSLHWVLALFSCASVLLSWIAPQQNDVNGTRTISNESSYVVSKKQQPQSKALFNNRHSQIGGKTSPQLKNPQWNGELMQGDDFVSLAISGEKEKYHTTVSYFLFADRITYIVSNDGRNFQLPRKRPMEYLFQRALDHLHHAEKGWPTLRSVLRGNLSLPLIVNYSDVTGCYGNVMTLESSSRLLGVFTMSMPSDPDCPIRLALPNYFTLDALNSVKSIVEYNKKNAPKWENKKDKAVWRGTLNDGKHRWKLAQVAVRESSLLDVGFTGVQANWNNTNLTEVGGLLPMMEMNHYSNYKAILDVDGNSWSGRLGHLLCMDAVVIKVSPGDVDYFWSDLVPYHHYVPVDENLDNLLDQVRWVISEPNRSQAIIKKANSWCRRKLRMKVLVHDLLDIWDAYASMVVSPTRNGEI